MHQQLFLRTVHSLDVDRDTNDFMLPEFFIAGGNDIAYIQPNSAEISVCQANYLPIDDVAVIIGEYTILYQDAFLVL